MKLIGLMPCRNEDWILGLSARVALKWCDELIVLNHASTDATEAILRALSDEFGTRIQIYDEPGTDWSEMVHRQRLLSQARLDGATHIAIVDADEILCGDSLPNIRPWAESLMPGECLNVRMHCMWRSLEQYRVDPGVWADRRDLALVFCDAPNLCWAAGPDGYQHHQRAPRGNVPVSSCIAAAWRYTRHREFNGKPDIGVMHLQFADWRRLLAKQRLYRLRDRINHPAMSSARIEALYAPATNEAGLQLAQAHAAWWEPYADLMHHIKLGEVPWFEAECERLLAEHGMEKFEGLKI